MRSEAELLIRLLSCLPLVLGAALGACQSQDESRIGPICPTCGPSSGGETGDFGGETIVCHALVSAEREQVEADGLDVSEFERRLARPIDVPLHWWHVDRYKPPAERRDVPTSGYEVDTRLHATISLTGPFRFQRVDDALCVETPCDGNRVCVSQAEVDVRVELRSEDGAVQATAEGVAAQLMDPEGASREQDDPYFDSTYFMYFNSDSDLRDVIGTLRFAPPAGGASFHGRLRFSGRLLPDDMLGDLGIVVEVDEESEEWITSGTKGEYVFPLAGAVGYDPGS